MQGTRIPLDLLLELVDAGLSVDDILKEYPHLKGEDLLMVLQVARKAHETIKYERLRLVTEAYDWQSASYWTRTLPHQS